MIMFTSSRLPKDESESCIQHPGSVKILTFDRSCEWIASLWQVLHKATWTRLSSSLVAGTFSGTSSFIVSQPADAALAYEAHGSAAKLVLFEACIDVVEKGGMGRCSEALPAASYEPGASSPASSCCTMYSGPTAHFGKRLDDLSQVYSRIILTN